MKKVIVNADDFGLSLGTNRAIEQLLNSGALTSATLMANGAAFENAVKSILATNRKWAIGLHVNLTQFCPVGGGAGLNALLDDNGCFRGRSALIRAWLTGRVSEAAIAAEIQAQFDACLKKGIKLDHMDSHQHAHAVPVVSEAMNIVAEEKGVPVRALRPHVERPTWKRKLKAGVLNWMHTRTNRGDAVNTVDNMTLVSIFSSDCNPSVSAYSNLLASCPGEVIELMVHPADVDAGHKTSTKISAISLLDYEVLSSLAWLEFQRNSGYEFVTFSELSKTHCPNMICA